jgi:hypothetical protein
MIKVDEFKPRVENRNLITNFVASAGIEPASGASEALILSIVLRGQKSI